jgi:hypothetical protein
MDIEDFVAEELEKFEGKKKIPVAIFVTLAVFMPVVTYITLQTTISMYR